MSEAIDLISAIFRKTDAGQHEIQTRSLGLAPLVRRTLVLVDGKRTGAELSVFLGGQGDILPVLQELLDTGCVLAEGRGKPAASEGAAPARPAVAAPAAPSAGQAESALPDLPPAASRSAKDNEMARNFMINTVNGIIGHNTRLSLIEEIFHAADTEALRKAYLHWTATMSDHSTGARRLPELRKELFKVL